MKKRKSKLNHLKKNKKIWIDLDNSPHVPFFIPIIMELEKRGHSVFLTIRDCFQVCGLADYYKLDHKNRETLWSKQTDEGSCTLWRSLQLAPHVLREKPGYSLSHGSRSLILLSTLLRIPTVLLFDYEYSQSIPFIKPVVGVAPEVIQNPKLARHFKQGLRGYRGLKEDVYVCSFTPDRSIGKKLALKENEIVVTIRPPATEAHEDVRSKIRPVRRNNGDMAEFGDRIALKNIMAAIEEEIMQKIA